jgi:hypothetical protein
MTAAQQKTAAHPSHNILERIDFFTVKASNFSWSHPETTTVPETGNAGA